MIRYRPFLNGDPPLLTAVWRGCVGRRGLAQPITTVMLDQLVLSKPYFDRTGLILALDDDRPVGFVHAGFGPNEDESGLSTELGVIVMLLVVAHPEEAAIAARLVALAEEYLRSQGNEGDLRRRRAADGAVLLGTVWRQRIAGRVGFRSADASRVSRRRLSRNRPHGDSAPRSERLPPLHRPPANANPPRHGLGNRERSAAANLVGSLHDGPMRANPLSPSSRTPAANRWRK